MSLTLRNLKGSPLTWTEGDDNLTYLEGLATGLSSSISGLSFSYILGVGNETNSNDIILSDGDVIDAANGGGQLDLRYGGDNITLLSNDAGAGNKEFLKLEPSYVELSSYENDGYVAIYAGSSGCDTSSDYVGHYLFIGNYTRIGFEAESGDKIAKFGSRKNVFPLISDYNIRCGATLDGFSSLNDGDIGSTIISSRNSTINAALSNSVILGGTGITATMSNTVYVPDLVIQDNKKIKAASGLGQLDLRYGGDNKVMLSTDAGAYANEFVYLDNGYVAIQSTRTGGGVIDMFADEFNAGFSLGGDGTISQRFKIYVPGMNFETFTDAGAVDSSYSTLYLMTTQDRFRLGETAAKSVLSFASAGGSIVTQGSSNQPSCIISSEGSTIIASVYNTTILGGTGITATMSNTVYVPNLVANGAVITLSNLPTYANNADAVAGSLPLHCVYKTAGGELRIVV